MSVFSLYRLGRLHKKQLKNGLNQVGIYPIFRTLTRSGEISQANSLPHGCENLCKKKAALGGFTSQTTI